MNVRIRTVLLALAAAASLPVASNAASDNIALEECIQAFVKEAVPPQHAVEIRRDHIEASVKNIGFNRKKVELLARGAKYGKLFGQATCVMTREGALVAMYVRDGAVRIAGTTSRPKVIRPS
jgi:hypothetical protein